jgi:hypothetical protein
MSLLSSLFRPSLNRKQRRAPRRNSLPFSRVLRAKPSVECLEDRVVPSQLTDPYTLYTYGDGYIGAPGQDEKSFLATYHPFDPALGVSAASPLSRLAPDVTDPGSPGPFAVTTQFYNLGDLAFRPTDAPWAASGIELTGEIKAPTDLGTTTHPVIVLMHGRHSTTYLPPSGGGVLEWPPSGGRVSIPSYQGYDYLGDVLASQGYVVVSVSANGINARDNSAADAGALARAQLMQRTFGILDNLNVDGVIRTRPADATHPGTDLFSGTSSPFGTRYVGKLNLQNIGIMGHSRGGEGVVRSFILNQSLGSPYGIKAVFALAPIDFQNELINNVPFAVLLPYNDGDVSDLQGAHFFDDSRYNVAGDTGPKYSIEVMGADHNFYNTVWSPGLFPFAGAPAGAGGTADDGNAGPPSRLTETQQQGTGLAYMAAFFHIYLGGDTQFLPIMRGDAAPPPSAQVTADRIHISYLPPDNAGSRRDVNRLLTAANLTTNTLGGAVTTGGLNTYTIAGPVVHEVNRGNQLTLGYTGSLTAFYENDLPAGTRDERGYNDLEFRIGLSFPDPRNPVNMPQDFSVQLTDGNGMSFSVIVSAFSNDLFYPPQSSNPHEVLNSVRIPLSAFQGHIDLSNVTTIRFNFDQHNSGVYQIADLAFADGPLTVQMSPTNNNLLIRNNPSIAGNVQVVNATTAAVLAEYVISSIPKIQENCDSSTDTLTVSYQYGNPLPLGGLDYHFGAGVDTLNVDDQTTSTPQTFTVTGNSVQRSGSAPITFLSGGINFVNVIGGTGGGDTYNVLGTEPGWTTTINANGADTVNVGNAGSLAGIQGTLNLENEPNFNTVNIDDQADGVAHTAVIDTVTRTGDTSLGRLTGVGASDITWDYFDTSTVNLNFGSGTSTVNVLATADAPYFITTNIFNVAAATINVGNAGSLAGIQGQLNLENEPNFDTVNINDQADAAAHTAVIDTVTRSGDTSLGRLTGVGAAAITWDYFDTSVVNLNFGGGTSTVNVLATADGPFFTTTNVFNVAAATINVGNAGSLAGILGPLNLENEPSFDTVNINDQADAANYTASITTIPRSGDSSLGSLNGLGAAQITWDYLDTASVTINSGTGFVIWHIEGTGVPTTINGTLGTNAFVVCQASQLLANIAGPLTLLGSGADVVEFFDQNNPASETYMFDSVPSNLSLSTVPVSVNFSGIGSVYLETNGFSTVNDASGTVLVDTGLEPY